MFLAELATTKRSVSARLQHTVTGIWFIAGAWASLIAGCSSSPTSTDYPDGASGSYSSGQAVNGGASGASGFATGGSIITNGTNDAIGSAGGSRQNATNTVGGTSGVSGVKAGASGSSDSASEIGQVITNTVGGTSGATSDGGNSVDAGVDEGAQPVGSCTSVASNPYPFGCELAWGTNDTGDPLASLSFLNFVSKWVDWQITADGTVPSCDGCNWLTAMVASTNLIPVYYAYFIGFFGHANGLQDQNVNPNGPNLATDGAELIRNNRSKIVDMYAAYARDTYAVWKTKPLVWLLEGDFIQYEDTGQKNPLSYTELAQITADITCAIKTNMPNSVVAVNHTTWNGDEETNGFWGAMKDAGVAYDLVWTTGVANNNGFIESAGAPGYYNAATATYSYIHTLTGRPILVDTSFGLSGMSDSWSTASAATLNQRIADGVLAINVGELEHGIATYETAIETLTPQLDKVCEAP